MGTRIMTDRSASQRGLVPYVVHMVRDEGVASLYKGFVPNFARIGRCCSDLSQLVTYDRRPSSTMVVVRNLASCL